FLERMVTMPSGATRKKASAAKAGVGAAAAAPWASAARGLAWRAKITPPPASELIFRNSRRARRAVCIRHLAGGGSPYSSAEGCRRGKSRLDENMQKFGEISSANLSDACLVVAFQNRSSMETLPLPRFRSLRRESRLGARNCPAP